MLSRLCSRLHIIMVLFVPSIAHIGFRLLDLLLSSLSVILLILKQRLLVSRIIFWLALEISGSLELIVVGLIGDVK